MTIEDIIKMLEERVKSIQEDLQKFALTHAETHEKYIKEIATMKYYLEQLEETKLAIDILKKGNAA